MEETGVTGEVWDADWRLAYVTDDYRLSAGGGAERAEVVIGAHVLSTEWTDTRLAWRGGPTLEAMRRSAERLVPYLLAEAPGGRDELRARADPRFHDIVDALEPREPPEVWSYETTLRYGTGTTMFVAVVFRIRDADGGV